MLNWIRSRKLKALELEMTKIDIRGDELLLLIAKEDLNIQTADELMEEIKWYFKTQNIDIPVLIIPFPMTVTAIRKERVLKPNDE